MPARQILGILRFAPLRMTSEGLGMTRSDSILPGKISVTRRKDFSRLWAAQREFCSRFLRGRFPFRLIVHSDRPLDRSLAGTGNQLTLGWRIHRAFGDVCDPTSGPLDAQWQTPPRVRHPIHSRNALKVLGWIFKPPFSRLLPPSLGLSARLLNQRRLVKEAAEAIAIHFVLAKSSTSKRRGPDRKVAF